MTNGVNMYSKFPPCSTVPILSVLHLQGTLPKSEHRARSGGRRHFCHSFILYRDSDMAAAAATSVFVSRKKSVPVVPIVPIFKRPSIDVTRIEDDVRIFTPKSDEGGAFFKDEVIN